MAKCLLIIIINKTDDAQPIIQKLTHCIQSIISETKSNIAPNGDSKDRRINAYERKSIALMRVRVPIVLSSKCSSTMCDRASSAESLGNVNKSVNLLDGRTDY